MRRLLVLSAGVIACLAAAIFGPDWSRTALLGLAGCAFAYSMANGSIKKQFPALNRIDAFAMGLMVAVLVVLSLRSKDQTDLNDFLIAAGAVRVLGCYFLFRLWQWFKAGATKPSAEAEAPSLAASQPAA